MFTAGCYGFQMLKQFFISEMTSTSLALWEYKELDSKVKSLCFYFVLNYNFVDNGIYAPCYLADCNIDD